jgi:ribosomal protein S9
MALRPFAVLGLSPEEYDGAIEVAGSDPLHRQQPRAVAHAVAGALSTLDRSYSAALEKAGFRFRIYTS